ncbi:MAG: hypothetical protein V1726_03345 [Methanobacteriota archaeon]
MSRLNEVTEQIKVLKEARDILKEYYAESDFHKQKETHPHEVGPSSPHDEEIYKLLTAIQQLDYFLKKLQDEQFLLLKKHEAE